MGYAEKRWVVFVATAGWALSALTCAALAVLSSTMPWSLRIFLALYAVLGVAMALHSRRRVRVETFAVASVGGALEREAPDGLAQRKNAVLAPVATQPAVDAERGEGQRNTVDRI